MHLDRFLSVSLLSFMNEKPCLRKGKVTLDDELLSKKEVKQLLESYLDFGFVQGRDGRRSQKNTLWTAQPLAED